MTSHSPAPRAAILFLLLICFCASALLAANPEMEKAFKLLQTAKTQLQSSFSPKADPLPLVEAAKDALKKGPGIYHGHRVKAIEAADQAIAELRTGDRAHKAVEYIDKAISEIHAGGGLSK